MIETSRWVAVVFAIGCSPRGDIDPTGMPPTSPAPPPIVVTPPTDGPAPTTSEVGCDGTFPEAWIRGGPDCPGEPVVQVHYHDADTVILRQSLCTSFEAPFLYLLFGTDRVLLEDTGAGGIPIAGIVTQIIDDWLVAHGRTEIELWVVNSHGHGDHTAGNAALAEVSGATVVGATADAVSAFFSIPDWPDGGAEIDLGDRIVDLLPIPGHQSAHIALYDRRAGLLLTGDSLYPGRLYIADFPTYRQSMRKLEDFTVDRSVCHVLGTHIEMSRTAGQDYPFGATDHPDERALQLDRSHLVELNQALSAMADAPMQEVHDDFIVYP